MLIIDSTFKDGNLRIGIKNERPVIRKPSLTKQEELILLEDAMRVISRNMQKLRKKKKATLFAIAEHCNTSEPLITNIENSSYHKGKKLHNPTLFTLLKIADALEVPFKELVRGVGNDR